MRLKPGKQTITAEVTSSATKKRDFVLIVRWLDKREKERVRVTAISQGVAPGETATLTAEQTLGHRATSCRPVVYGGKSA